MTIEELIKKLEDAENDCDEDWERVHSRQDDALLDYINDDKVTEIFNRTPKWYA